MLKPNILLFALLLSFIGFSQVGIGTVAPTADLEIMARTSLSAGEHNGIIIPKVTTLPATIAPSGTILYLEGGANAGFYFSNGSSFQNVTDILSASGNTTFVENGTTTATTDINSDAQREGNLSIGGPLNSGRLNVEIEATDPVATRIGVRIENANDSPAPTNTYSLFAENSSNSTGIKYGVRTDVSSDGDGNRIGILNVVSDSNGAANNSVTGFYNDVSATDGAASINYGIRSQIGSASSTGTIYGVHSITMNTGGQDSYSGWFQGNSFAIRNQDASDGYDLPTTSGTTGQVLTAAGVNGVTTWQDLSSVANVSPIFNKTFTPTDPADTTVESIFRQGNMEIGKIGNTSILHVEQPGLATSEQRTSIFARNTHISTAGDTYALRAYNASSSNNDKTGIYSEVSAGGNGTHIGVESVVFDASVSSTNYGIKSEVGATGAVGSTAYGIYSEIGSASSAGTNYGIYAYSQHGPTSTDASYSGYFRGDSFAIRSEDDLDGYDMPTTSGTAGQVLTTDGSGTASWSDANSAAPVQYSLWQAGGYNLNDTTGYENAVGIQTVYIPSDIATNGEIQVKLILHVTQYAATSNFRLQAFDTDTAATTIIGTGLTGTSNLSYEPNLSGGFVTSGWVDYDAIGASGSIAQFLLQSEIISGPATLVSAYVLLRAR